MSVLGRIKRLVRPGPAPGARRKRAGSPAGKPRSAAGKTPPPLPEGWRIGPPDYIGIGVQKAGTTFWWKLIARHPQVVGELKETHQLTRLGWRPMFEADRESYYRFFPRPEGAITGEWTPRYMSVPGVVDTMKAVAPEARLLVQLRDPVERYRSGVGQWQKRKENRGKSLNLWAGRKDAYARSFYAFALSRYVEAFGRDRVLILQFEQCLADPAGQYLRTLEFLGLDEWLPDESILGKPVNVSKKRPSPKALDEPADVVETFEDDVRQLLAMAPDFDLTLWPNFRHLA
jgi:hypothetical protein